ncbi:MAG TPA: Fur family transcriptional regulator [Candidatus Limnocylindrales bacterium]|nr:Fur family transcriptional regulator [Candidatus Limnocylindrales bacterium]
MGATDQREVWAAIPGRLRARGLRWTPQRRALIGVLAESRGHLTSAEVVARCIAADPATTPSTVYRTLDVLEELGVIEHAHGSDGREEIHVLPDAEHGHLRCRSCGRTWELPASELDTLTKQLRRERGFEVDLSHVTIVGRCGECTLA